jgi:hypothetical protein
MLRAASIRRPEAHEPAVAAAATLTLALPKAGLQSAEARPHVGDL